MKIFLLGASIFALGFIVWLFAGHSSSNDHSLALPSSSAASQVQMDTHVHVTPVTKLMPPSPPTSPAACVVSDYLLGTLNVDEYILSLLYFYHKKYAQGCMVEAGSRDGLRAYEAARYGLQSYIFEAAPKNVAHILSTQRNLSAYGKKVVFVKTSPYSYKGKLQIRAAEEVRIRHRKSQLAINMAERIDIPVDILDNLLLQANQIFLMRVNARNRTSEILLGAEQLLKSRRIEIALIALGGFDTPRGLELLCSHGYKLYYLSLQGIVDLWVEDGFPVAWRTFGKKSPKEFLEILSRPSWGPTKPVLGPGTAWTDILALSPTSTITENDLFALPPMSVKSFY